MILETSLYQLLYYSHTGFLSHCLKELKSKIMATQEEYHALLGQSTPTANPVSSLASSAPEYDEPPPYTEEPAGPCECHCLYCQSISMLCTSLLDKHDRLITSSSYFLYTYPHIPNRSFCFSFQPLSFLLCRHESIFLIWF